MIVKPYYKFGKYGTIVLVMIEAFAIVPLGISGHGLLVPGVLISRQAQCTYSPSVGIV